MVDIQTKSLTIITIVLCVLIKADLLFSMNMTCALPVQSQNSKTYTDYIKLVEPKTVISFDSSQKIDRFTSPGCNKFESFSRWTNSFVIECISNNADSINLKIELLTLRFEKTYFKSDQKHLALTGFCKISKK